MLAKACAQRFGRDRRLRKRAEFVRIQASASRVVTTHFVLLLAANPAERSASSRLGVVVTRKIGCAVQRNRIKRLCRECFRRWPGLVPMGVDLVVIARGGAAELLLADVRAEWAKVERLVRRRAAELLARCATATHAALPSLPGTPSTVTPTSQ